MSKHYKALQCRDKRHGTTCCAGRVVTRVLMVLCPASECVTRAMSRLARDRDACGPWPHVLVDMNCNLNSIEMRWHHVATVNMEMKTTAEADTLP